MGVENLLLRAKKIFIEEVSEVIGAYFDGEIIFIGRLTENFETVELYADGSELEQIAEKISLVCRERSWKTSAIGFCLQEGDAVTFQTEVDNVPAKDIPALVKSWAIAQNGTEAVYSSAKVGEELWMETLPRTTLEKFRTTFRKFDLNLRGLSVMPADLSSKVESLDRAKFIAEVVRNKQTPNLLAARESVWSWKKISVTVAAIFVIALTIATVKIFLDYREASDNLDAAKFLIDELSEDVALKELLDADIADLNKLNKICAAQDVAPTKFNLLINLGKVGGGGVSLVKIRAEGNSLELEGIAATPDAVKSYLSRVKNSVAQSARLERSEKHDDEIIFVIRAAL